MSDELPKGFRYAAFISYRHVEPDRSVAVWLHRALETYRVPAKLASSLGIPRAIGRVFRDEEELPASADLSQEIENNLQQSRFLVVICSRRTPESRWIGEEIKRFRDLGRHDRILALLIDGEPGEAFPQNLCEIRRRNISEDGQEREEVEKVEPLAADLRPTRRESRSYLRRMALLRVLACLLGCRFDDLRQRDLERRRRRLLAWSAAALCVSAVVGFFAMDALKQSRLVGGERLAKVAGQLAVAAQQEARDHRPELAALLARQAFLFNEEIGGGNAQAVVDQALRQALAIPGFNVELKLPSKLHPLHLAFAADQSKLIVAAGEQTSGVMGGGGVLVWDLQNRKTQPIKLAGCDTPIRWVGVGSTGEILALSMDRKIFRWVAPDFAGTPDVVTATDLASGSELGFNPDGTRLAGLTAGGLVRIWSARDRKDVVTLDGEVPLGSARGSNRTNSMALGSLVYSPDGELLAAAAGGSGVRLWNFRSPTPSSTILSRSEKDLLASLTFTADGRRLCALNLGTVEMLVWEVKGVLQGETTPTTFRVPGTEFALSQAVSPDGSYIARGGMTRGGITLWHSIATEAPAFQLSGHETGVMNLKFSPRGTLLASCSPAEDFVRLWHVQPTADETRRISLDKHINRDFAEIAQSEPAMGFLLSGLYTLAFSPDGKRLAGGSSVFAGTETLWVWDVERPTHAPLGLRTKTAPMSAFLSGKSACTSVQFSADGRMLASTLGKTVTIWDTRDLEGEPLVLGFPKGLVHATTFSPKSEWLAAGGEGSDLMLWKIDDDFRAMPLEIGQSVFAVAFVPSRDWVAVGTEQGEVQLWDLTSRRRLAAHRLHDGIVLSLSVAGNGLLASGGLDGTLSVLSEDPRKKTQIFSRSLGQPIRALQFVEAGAQLAVALGSRRVQGRDFNGARGLTSARGKDPVDTKGSVLLFDLRPGRREQQPIRLLESEGGINALAVSPAQPVLAMGGDDRTIGILNPSTKLLSDAVCQRVWRNLTTEEWKRYVGAMIPYRRTCPDLP